MAAKRNRVLIFATAAVIGISAIAIGTLIARRSAVTYANYALNLDDHSVVESAISSAIANSRAVVYVNVDWSVTAVAGQERFEQLAKDWQRMHPELSVSFHCIDFTSASDGYSPITNLPGWAEVYERIGRFPFGGGGEIAWIADGRLVDMGRIAFGPTDDLILRTYELFTDSNPNAP